MSLSFLSLTKVKFNINRKKEKKKKKKKLEVEGNLRKCSDLISFMKTLRYVTFQGDKQRERKRGVNCVEIIKAGSFSTDSPVSA